MSLIPLAPFFLLTSYFPKTDRPVLVRFIISDVKPESCKFEQSFSTDGGKTPEVNWIAIETLVKE